MTLIFISTDSPLVLVLIEKYIKHLMTFVWKFSNIDFFLRLLPLKVNELLMSEMFKKWGVTDFV